MALGEVDPLMAMKLMTPSKEAMISQEKKGRKVMTPAQMTADFNRQVMEVRAPSRDPLPLRGTAQALLDAGAPPDAPDARGATPVHFAAMGGHRDVLRALAAAGADLALRPTCGEHAGRTPLVIARSQLHTAAARLLETLMPESAARLAVATRARAAAEEARRAAEGRALEEAPSLVHGTPTAPPTGPNPHWIRYSGGMGLVARQAEAARLERASSKEAAAGAARRALADAEQQRVREAARFAEEEIRRQAEAAAARAAAAAACEGFELDLRAANGEIQPRIVCES